MSQSFQIKVEPWAGSSIEDCAEEAVRLAQQLNQSVTFDFNEVHCIVLPDTIPSRLVDCFQKMLQSKRGYKIATGHPDK